MYGGKPYKGIKGYWRASLDDTRMDWFYDTSTRVWVVRKLTKEGDQIGDVMHCIRADLADTIDYVERNEPPFGSPQDPHRLIIKR